MVSVEEASAVILSQLYKPRVEAAALRSAVGRVLAEKIVADRDFPPFDRVAMDGIAVSYAAWEAGQIDFEIVGTQAAGMERKRLEDARRALEVMTGAMLPEGTDTVVRYEDLILKDKRATISIALEKGQNIHRQGNDARHQTALLEPGILLSPAEIALLASVGKSNVNVFSYPKTALISSGDELVDIDVMPAPHQIRRSNTYALEAAMAQLKWSAEQFHMPDVKEVLLKSLGEIAARHDVLILSGGVSKGKFDFIPEVMESIGIRKLFHQVSQRPGKPFWFGASAEGKVVFALPGNPVSTYMCFYRYIKPWLLKSLQLKQPSAYATLAKPFKFQPNLTYFLQVSIKNEKGKLMAYPDAGGGSGDFANLKHVDGFLELPLTRTEFEAGEAFPYIPFR